MDLSVNEILSFLNEQKYEFNLLGKAAIVIDGFASLYNLADNKITWVKKWDDENIHIIKEKKNLVVVCSDCHHIEKLQNDNNAYIICNCPKMIFFEIMNRFFCDNQNNAVISQTAKIYTDRIGQGCSIGDYSVISKDAVIGDYVTIGNHVTIIGKVNIGNYCKIESGVVIGEPGFGYYKLSNGHYKRVPHMGGVTIKDYVEIGANTCIDRGTIGDTTIGAHSKIDNLVHVGHNVKIGENVLVVAGVVLGGSCKLDDESYIAPGAVIRNQIEVRKKTFVGMQACVIADTLEGTTIMGVPAKIKEM